MTTAPIWLSEAEVVSLIDMGEAIQAVEHAFAAEAAGTAMNLDKTHLALSHGSVHSLGGTLLDDDLVGVKSWIHTTGGATPLLTLWRVSDGSLVAVIEAFALGQYRTASVAGAATHALARADATRLTMLGTGRQALTHVGAIAAVRPLAQVSVWSPDSGRRAAFAAAVTDALGVPASPASSVAGACEGADIVTVLTRATQPFLGAQVPPIGCHINAMGAISLDRAEVEPKILERCGAVVADSVVAVRALSREFQEFYGEADAAWAAVTPLCTLAGAVRRPDGADLTLFKSMGVGIADVAIGRFVYEQALENRLGKPIEAPAPARPRLRSNLRRPGVGYV